MEQLNDPHHLDPSDPHNLSGDEKPVLERVIIATEGNNCEECVTQLREPLMKLNGIEDVNADPAAEQVVVTFDARKTQVAEIHEAIERSGYKAAPFAS